MQTKVALFTTGAEHTASSTVMKEFVPTRILLDEYVQGGWSQETGWTNFNSIGG